jgi:hypothetical protein
VLRDRRGPAETRLPWIAVTVAIWVAASPELAPCLSVERSNLLGALGPQALELGVLPGRGHLADLAVQRVDLLLRLTDLRLQGGVDEQFLGLLQIGLEGQERGG